MACAQLALNVDDLDEAIAFYATLFGTAPAKVKPGYGLRLVSAAPAVRRRPCPSRVWGLKP
jgi:predicted enzyme related to lactoylglutathione lyase